MSKFTVIGIPNPEIWKEYNPDNASVKWLHQEPFIMPYVTERQGLVLKQVIEAFQRMEQAVQESLGWNERGPSIFFEEPFKTHHWERRPEDAPTWVFINRELGHVLVIKSEALQNSTP